MLITKRGLKPLAWMGSSFDDLRGFPDAIRKDAGFQLHRLQAGLEAADWKPLTTIGRGVEEIRLRNETGAWRIIYLARFEDAIYILHCFNKKTQRTSGQDKHIAKTRYLAVVQAHRSHS